MIYVVMCFIAFGFVSWGARWLAVAGGEAGDRVLDAKSTLVTDPDGRRALVVANPGPRPVVVGMTARRSRPSGLDRLRSSLVIRSARWYERRRHDRGADVVLGAVEPGAEGRWVLPFPVQPARVVVTIGQDDGRLRVHEHLVGAASG